MDVAAEDISSGSWQAFGFHGPLAGRCPALYVEAAHTLLSDTCASHTGDIEGGALRRHNHNMPPRY